MNVVPFAWRESRGARARLLLFSSSIILGVASLVAVTSFVANLRAALDLNAKSLLGADILIRSSRPFGPEEETFLAGIGGEQAREVSFSTMAGGVESGRSRLAQVRALAGGFPFYGEISAEPPGSASAYRTPGLALADKSLILQLGLGIGDHLRLGEAEFKIAGTIDRIPGDSPLWESIAPRVFIALESVPSTGLVKFGSRVNHRAYIRAPGRDSDELGASLEAEAKRLRLRIDTVEERKRAVERVSENIHWYLRLSSFFALVLGTLGVASGVRLYLTEKTNTVAILRCLGAKRDLPVRIFLAQVLIASTAASVVGVVLGAAFQRFFPYLFRRVLPTEVALSVSWESIALGLVMGAAVSALVCLDALWRLRTVRPLEILRASSPDEVPRPVDGMKRRAVIALLLFVLSLTQAQSAAQAAVFFFFLLAAVALLAGASRAVKAGAGLIARNAGSFVFRQGYLNLHRANNQTLVLTLVIGFAVLFVTTTLFLRGMLLDQIRLSAGDDRPNMMLFDIQNEQLPEVRSFLAEERLPEIAAAPVVTMRLQSVGGRPVREILQDSASAVPEWTLQREYRSTYRDQLWDSEELVAGEFVPRYSGNGDVPISIEDGLAEKLKIGLGAKLIFDVQGLEVSAEVASLRKVQWQRLQPNFFVVFPAGVLEDAPQSHIIGTRAASAESSAEIQRRSVSRFPNVSMLDLSTVMKIVDDVLGKFSIVVEVVGLCLLAVALVILGGAVQGSFRARVREQALLKVLGAKRRQLFAVTATEYLILGAVGAASGSALGVLASWLLGLFVLKSSFSFQPPALLIPLAITPLIAALIGVAGSASAFRHKPLEVLRNE